MCIYIWEKNENSDPPPSCQKVQILNFGLFDFWRWFFLGLPLSYYLTLAFPASRYTHTFISSCSKASHSDAHVSLGVPGPGGTICPSTAYITTSNPAPYIFSNFTILSFYVVPILLWTFRSWPQECKGLYINHMITYRGFNPISPGFLGPGNFFGFEILPPLDSRKRP